MPAPVIIAAMAALLREAGEEPETEFRFSPPRKWRFDLALPRLKIAIEVEGGLFLPRGSRGWMAHASPTAIQRDMEKYNRAQALGWRVFRCSPSAPAGSPVSWQSVLSVVRGLVAR